MTQSAEISSDVHNELHNRLCAAIDNGDSSRVIELTAQGAKPLTSTKTPLSHQPLFIAATGPNPAIISFLLDQLVVNATPHALSVVETSYRRVMLGNNDAKTAFKNHPGLVHHTKNMEHGLSLKDSLRQREITLADILIKAVKENDLAKVTTLIADGCPVNGKNEWDETALHYATRIAIDPEPMINLLLDSNANPHQRDHLGDAAIHWGVRAGATRVVAALLNHPTNPTEPNFPGHLFESPAHMAVNGGHIETLTLLSAQP